MIKFLIMVIGVLVILNYIFTIDYRNEYINNTELNYLVLNMQEIPSSINLNLSEQYRLFNLEYNYKISYVNYDNNLENTKIENVEEEKNEFYFLTEKISDFLINFENISVFYENLENRFTYAHNANEIYFGASVTKLPFAFYIWQKAYNDNTNLNTKITYTQADYRGGSGIIRHNYEFGQMFTQRELLHLMISPSDNIATRMLRRYHGINSYRNFIYEVGANPNFVHNITYSHINAYDGGLFARKIFYFIQEDNEFAQGFKRDLIANRYPFIFSDYTFASKSGWATEAYHDIAIVFAESPYTLTILSRKVGNQNDRNVFREISLFFQEINKFFY
ncbi:MAG: class A beta-lactamase-related serine hydrolase [Defluviitaleaceae bacterium]|nr:class A beta-lactamase-related serine hydrolase [Defluviitaleaceae bacterium]